MTALACEMRTGLRRLAEPIPAGDSIKAQIGRAARAANLTYSRAFELWYGRARRIDAHELEAVRTARLRKVEERHHELTAVATDLEALAQRMAVLASRSGGQEAERARALAGRVRGLAAANGLSVAAPDERGRA